MRQSFDLFKTCKYSASNTVSLSENFNETQKCLPFTVMSTNISVKERKNLAK